MAINFANNIIQLNKKKGDLAVTTVPLEKLTI